MRLRKKIALVAVAATMVLGVTVFAATGIVSSWNASSSSNYEYKTLPTAKQSIKDIGYEPCLIEEFDNGYIFKDGSIINNTLNDDSNTAVEKFKSVSFRYQKNDDKVIFSQDKYDYEMELAGDIIYSDNGIDIYYMSFTNKLVPGDYKLTEEDKKAEASGDLIFSYGTDEISISEVKGVSWNNDNVQYGLTQIDGNLSADDLVEMAKEVIAESK